jgi:RND family efflux transporter MFP subunit
MQKVAWVVAALGIVTVPGALFALKAHTPERPSPERTVRVVRRDIETTVKATGVIKPEVGAEVRVGSRASGVVGHLYVRIGDHVDQGQLLAELDDRELVARRDQAAAALESARAQLGYAVSDLGRKRALAKAQVIAPEAVELAERADAVARQQVVEAAAGLAYARTELGFTRIRAPISGVVASVSTQEGETVSATLAAPTFLTLIDLDRLEVRAYVDETDIGRIRMGQPARSVDTYGDEPFEGTVSAVYPQAEIRDNVVNYVTVITFETPRDRTLRPEMTATVAIALQSQKDVLVVPRPWRSWFSVSLPRIQGGGTLA